MTDKLTFAADVAIDLQASAAGKKLPTFAIHAYTGAPMRLAGHTHPVIVDLQGVKAGKADALLNHDEDRLLGQGETRVDAGGVWMSGTITAEDANRDTVVNHAKNGFRWQASIGAEITKREFLAAGQKAHVNGQEVAGPMVIAREVDIHEVSFVRRGADSNTSAAIAAKKEKTMSELTTNPDDILQAERARVLEIDRLTIGEWHEASAEVNTLRAKALAGEIDVPELQGHLLRIIRASRPVYGDGVKTRQGGRGAASGDVLQASLMIRAGHETAAEKAFGEQAVEAARRARIGSLYDLCQHTLRAAGHSSDQYGTKAEVIRAAFSTSSLPNILSNVVGRTLEAAYAETTMKWRQFCYVASAANFKPQSAIRPSAIQNLEKLNAGGEIKHGTIGEEDKYDWKVSTYAKMLGVTRDDIVNDDLGFVSELAPMLGVAAGRTLNDLVWETILGGQTAGFFASGNANLAEAGSALAIGTLGAGVTAMRKQRDSQNYDIDISPAVLVVPPDLEQTARPILNSAELLGLTSGTQPSGNPAFGIVPSLIVESRISNTARFTNATATQWFLFAAPSARGVTVGFLDGRSAPTVELQDAPFDRLGIQMRVYHDFGCALSDPKAAYKATGAAGGE